jgi:hypothetical protein
MNWLTRLYPRAWRERYGEEFDALLEDAPPTWRDAADIFVEACKVHLTTGRSLVTFVAAGLILGASLSLIAPRRYVSTGVVRVVSEPGADFDFDRIVSEMLSRSNLAEIVVRPSLDLYKSDRTRVPMEDITQKMRQDIRITREQDGDIAVSFAYPDENQARLTAEALVEELQAAINVRGRMTAALWRQAWPNDPPPAKSVAEVATPATLPTRGEAPWRLYLALGGLAGLLAATVWWLPRRLTAFALAGAAAAAAFSFVVPDRYTSAAVVRMLKPQAPQRLWGTLAPEALTDRFQRIENRITTPDNLRQIALKMKMAPADAERGIRIEPAGSTTYRVSFTYPDRRVAQRMVRELVTQLAERNVEIERAVYHAGGEARVAIERKAGANFEVLDPASLPESPVFPNRLVIAGLGAPVGLLAGIFELRRRTVIRAQ